MRLSKDIVIKNGQIVSPTEAIYAGIAINDGKIVAIVPVEYLPEANKTIDAKDKYVIPGFVGNHCHIEVQMIISQDTYGGCFEKEASGPDWYRQQWTCQK